MKIKNWNLLQENSRSVKWHNKITGRTLEARRSYDNKWVVYCIPYLNKKLNTKDEAMDFARNYMKKYPLA